MVKFAQKLIYMLYLDKLVGIVYWLDKLSTEFHPNQYYFVFLLQFIITYEIFCM